ncbi:CAS specific exportin for Srp1p required for accurate mitotic chromosome segregation [Scheffersomyces xylosifermentans]|uniref:CAS specific exportin for Srp1p required for accurate mitotic chromosome segregation n=1 Tax=Scheffersomyces xylosifermentans TaxID=1304137 RepID=UPI00315C6D99
MAENSLEAIPRYLEQSLSPQHAKAAETQLKSIETLPGFSINLLHVIASTNLSPSVRLAGALFFKNLVKRKWIDADGSSYLLPVDDVASIKSEILDIMIKLPNQLQVQIGEAITLIAESDFPQNWPNLIDNLVGKLSLEDFVSNKAILLVSHSIFKKWRPLFRSDELFSEILLVLNKFTDPFLKLFVEVDRLIDQNASNEAQLSIYLENLLLLLQIYFDFNCQDIPEFFEDNMNVLMEVVHKYLVFNSPLIRKDDEDEEIDILIKVKTSIIELISLYITRYADVFEPLVQTFITSVWDLINNYVTKQQKYDLLVGKALHFLTSVVKMPAFQGIFQNESSINEIIDRIILPNIYFREVDEEQFEDEPIHFVRSDLEGSDFDSRRKSATDFLRELKELNSELLTNTVMKYVNQFLSVSSNDDWRNKDIAIYLFSSLATKGSVTNVGVTSTNVLVDVVKFFTENIANDLVSGTAHPILKVDSIKYIFTFRNQLTKEQLVATLPMLINHLDTRGNPVVYTYSAITIEKLLAMINFHADHAPVFNKHDIAPFVNDLLTRLFNLILLYDSTPEKLAENEFLVKAIMRILHTAEDTLTSEQRLPIIDQLLQILRITARNPSNPKFSHYIFESLGLLIKYGTADITRYMELVVPALLNILGEDVQEFVPYTFQILAYLLESYPRANGVPETYKNLVKPLLAPRAWEFRGNIPGITRLLVAIVEHDPSVFISHEDLTPLLGVFQKLISSKLNDSYGFDLLQSILLNIPLSSLQQYLNQVALLLLTRLKNSRTDKFAKRFTLLITTIASISLDPSNSRFNNASSLNGEFIIGLIDSVQQGVFQMIYNSFVLPTSSTIANLQDKKIANLGISQFLTTQAFTSGVYVSLTTPTIDQLVKNISSYSGISKSSGTAAAGSLGNGTVAVSNAPLSDLDLDTSSFGSNFSKIASISNKPFDPVSSIKNNDYEAIKLGVVSNIKKANAGALNGLSNETTTLLHSIGM